MMTIKTIEEKIAEVKTTLAETKKVEDTYDELSSQAWKKVLKMEENAEDYSAEECEKIYDEYEALNDKYHSFESEVDILEEMIEKLEELKGLTESLEWIKEQRA